MITKGIRGAITVEENTEEAIKTAAVTLFKQLIQRNFITEKQISHIIFTTTSDLNAAYPAKFIRSELGWNNTAMVCLPELQIQDSLSRCIRVLIVINCQEGFVPKYVYLGGAQNLRK